MSTILTHHVQKAFEDGELRRLPGECVNALPWRTRPKLETQRYIAPLPEGAEPVADAGGRYWLGTRWMEQAGRTRLDERAWPQRLPGVGRWQLSDGTTLNGVSRERAEAAEAGLPAETG